MSGDKKCNEGRGHGAKLPRKQEQAIAVLLVSPTISEAARALSVAEITLWRWLQRPEFEAQYRAARRKAIDHAIARLQQATRKAVDALEAIVTDTATPPAARVGAARTILDMSLRAVEIDDLAARVQALEEGMPSGDADDPYSPSRAA